MKFCIISDLHCKHQLDVSETSDTLLLSNKPRFPVNQHPVVDMLRIIEEEELSADILLCLGDLGDKADEQGIISAWTFLEEIRAKLNAKLKIGIPGNHDVNSRNILGKEAFSYIKNFHETFPTIVGDLNIKFWEKAYCIQTIDDTLVLLINTVHNHTDADKAQQSEIKSETLESISNELNRLNYNAKYKICILHHHPIKHSNISNWKDSDSIEKGDDLVSILNKCGFNIIVHGHKHQPRIVEYNNLPIFAAGSFSSFANLQGTGINTMFHIINLNDSDKKGFIESWEYTIRNGWEKSYNRSFPYIVGFGASNIDEKELAAKVNSLVEKGKPRFYGDILSEEPNLKYIIPENLVKLGELLKKEYGLIMEPEYPLNPIIITFKS